MTGGGCADEYRFGPLANGTACEAEGGPLLPDAFRLASAFPRRVFERPADGGGALHEAMEAAGLGGGQVALSLEA